MGLALFDLDNTLLDREAAFARWASGFIREHGLPAEAATALETADQDGMTPRETFFDQVRSEFDMVDAVDDLIDRYYVDYPSYYTVDPRTVDGLRLLRRQGWRVGVVTNGGPAQLAKLETTNLTAEFDGICVSELVGTAKPDPAIFEMAAELCGSSLEGWMTGDSVPADMAGGRAVGLRTIWMARGRPWPPSDPAPDAAVESVPRAIEIILERGERRT